jgi:hypothetical protein
VWHAGQVYAHEQKMADLAESALSLTARRRDIRSQIQRHKKEMKAASCSKARKRELSALVRALEDEKETLVRPSQSADGRFEKCPESSMDPQATSMPKAMPTDTTEGQMDDRVQGTMTSRLKRRNRLTKWQKQDLEAEKIRRETCDVADRQEIERSTLRDQLHALSLDIYDIPPDGHW